MFTRNPKSFRPTVSRCCHLAACWLVLCLATAPAHAELADELAALAPDADAHVLALAVKASACAARLGKARAPQKLAVIDYSRVSLLPRMWIFDLKTRSLLLTEHVAHGRGSGDNLPTKFSNDEGSFQSSLGLFKTADSYIGKNGRSLRLHGLEAGVNDQALTRAVVVHGADYADPAFGRLHGRLGRSHGCPAVRPQVVDTVIDALLDGQQLFIYYPQDDWLSESALLHCDLP